jgi:hypothetical protein
LPYLEQQPLLLGERLRDHPDELQAVRQADGGLEFLAAAEDVSRAGNLIVDWLRATMPGYPALCVPHIAAGAIWSTAEPLHAGFSWLAPSGNSQELTSREVVERLGLEEVNDRFRQFPDALDRLRRPLLQTREFRRLETTRAALETRHYEELTITSRSIADATAVDVVTEAVGPYWGPAVEYCRHQLEAALVELSREARDYCSAFVDFDRLLQHIMMVVGAIAVDRPGEPLPGHHRLVWRGRDRRLWLSIPSTPDLPRRGSLLLIDFDIIGLRGVAMVEGVAWGTDKESSVSARVLADSEILLELMNSGGAAYA